MVSLREKNVALRKELETTKKTLSERLTEVQVSDKCTSHITRCRTIQLHIMFVLNNKD